MSVLSVRHGPPQTLASAVAALEAACPGFTATLAHGAPCPECAGHWDKVHPNQLFCSSACRTAFNRRCATRGRQLLPYAMAARQTRDGTRGASHHRETGKRAASDASLLLQRWRDEDRIAKRADWCDFVDARYRAGFESR